jgi:hypothetical protein
MSVSSSPLLPGAGMPGEGTENAGDCVEKSEMVGLRTVWAALLPALVASAGFGIASADPPPWAHSVRQGFEAPHSHGMVSGRILAVDYGDAAIVVATPRGPVPVAVTPSTSIFRGGGYASLADLSRGARVDIDVTDVGGRLIAQVIRIR